MIGQFGDNANTYIQSFSNDVALWYIITVLGA